MPAPDESQQRRATRRCPTWYLGKAVSNADCDALASHARNRLRSDRDDRCQDSRRHFPFVAHGAAIAALLLWKLVSPQRTLRPGGSCSATQLRIRGSRSRIWAGLVPLLSRGVRIWPPPPQREWRSPPTGLPGTWGRGPAVATDPAGLSRGSRRLFAEVCCSYIWLVRFPDKSIRRQMHGRTKKP